MSQIGGKMSKFQGEFVIVSIDLRIILSNYVATDVYALFKKSIKKNLLRNVQKRGGWVNGCLNNVQKNCRFGDEGHPLVRLSENRRKIPFTKIQFEQARMNAHV